MNGFTRTGQVVSTEFEPVEAALLTQLAGQVAGILTEQDTAPDAAVTRLLPDAYADDPEKAAEFRRFTAPDLTARKVQNAQTVIADVAHALVAETPTPVELDPRSTQAWVRALTDMRLVLASRLGIVQDGDPGRADDEAFMLGDLYDWLGGVQECLVGALDD
ncbi:MAG: hypothetical protein RI885_2569 [Actinomycetota bacterium]|jgi:cytochrome P450